LPASSLPNSHFSNLTWGFRQDSVGKVSAEGPPTARQTIEQGPPTNLPPGEMKSGSSPLLARHRTLRQSREEWARTRQQELRHFVLGRVDALSTPEHIKIALTRFFLELTSWQPSVRQATEAICHLLPSERMLLVIHLREILDGTPLNIDWQENAIVISQRCEHTGLFCELRLLPNQQPLQRMRFFDIETKYPKREESALDSSTFAYISLSLLGV
jgi:hypothetical protein